MFKNFFYVIVFFPVLSQAAVWSEHQKNIEELERSITKYEEEMATMVEKKNKTRDPVRIEETLQRIVDIHGALITLRKDMDQERSHIESEHPEKAHILDSYDSRSLKAGRQKKKYRGSALSQKLDKLLIKVQLKFSSFMRPEVLSEDMQVVEKVVEVKRKRKREREADVYLRRRSKVKMTK